METWLPVSKNEGGRDRGQKALTMSDGVHLLPHSGTRHIKMTNYIA